MGNPKEKVEAILNIVNAMPMSYILEILKTKIANYEKEQTESNKEYLMIYAHLTIQKLNIENIGVSEAVKEFENIHEAVEIFSGIKGSDKES